MFVSLFFPVFLGIVTLCYFALPAKCRPAILFFASCAFCASLDIRSLIILFISILFTYCGGILLEHAGKNSFRPRKIHFMLAVLLSLCLLLLLVFKYTGYIFQRFFPELTFTRTLLPYFLMPVGFSFYLFQRKICCRDQWFSGTISMINHIKYDSKCIFTTSLKT